MRVDTTGNPTTANAAIALNDSIDVQDVVVTRSGNAGIYTLGRGINFQNVVVRNSLSYGIYLDGNNAAGSRSLELLGFTSQNNAAGVLIAADSVTVRNCVVTNNTGDGIVVAANMQAVQVHNCDLVTNTGFGINNASTIQVNATTNWWGSAAGATAGDGVNGNVEWGSLTGQFCSSSCSTVSMLPVDGGAPSSPAAPTRSIQPVTRAKRSRSRRR